MEDTDRAQTGRRLARQPGFRRCLRPRIGLTEFHVHPHLAVDDVSGNGQLPHWREKNRAAAEARDRQMARPLRIAPRPRHPSGRARPPYGSAPAPDSYPECRAVLTLIAATHWTVGSSAALVIPAGPFDHAPPQHRTAANL